MRNTKKNELSWYLGMGFLVFSLGLCRCFLDKLVILFQCVLEKQITFVAFVAYSLLLDHISFMLTKVIVPYFGRYHLPADIAYDLNAEE